MSDRVQQRRLLTRALGAFRAVRLAEDEALVRAEAEERRREDADRLLTGVLRRALWILRGRSGEAPYCEPRLEGAAELLAQELPEPSVLFTVASVSLARGQYGTAAACRDLGYEVQRRMVH